MVRNIDVNKPYRLIQFPVIALPLPTTFCLKNKTPSKQSFTLLADLLDKHTETLTATISHLMNGGWSCLTARWEIGELLSLGFPLLGAWQQWLKQGFPCSTDLQSNMEYHAALNIACCIQFFFLNHILSLWCMNVMPLQYLPAASVYFFWFVFLNNFCI